MTALGINDYPDPERRSFQHVPSPGGRRRDAESVWLRFVIPFVLAALVAYFTTTSTIQNQVTKVTATEQDHFDEVMRRLALIQSWQDRQDRKR